LSALSKELGIRTPKSLISRNTQRAGGTWVVAGTWRNTGHLEAWPIRNSSRKQLRAPNIYFLTRKPKKYQTSERALETHELGQEKKPPSS